MRSIPLVLAAGLSLAMALLSGCDNYVMSDKPWFTPEVAKSARDAQALRSGWWVMESSDCHFDPAAPSTAWPECVQPLLAPPDGLHVLETTDPDGAMEYRLAPGDPLILQYGLKGWSDKTGGDGKGPGERFDAYFYFGVEALKRDDQGRLIAVNFWPALCGPPPPRRKGESPYAGRVTTKPWPGLTVTKGGLCTARDVVALRGAVRRSRRLEGATDNDTSMRWLRAWRTGDQTQEEWLAAQGLQTH